MNLSHTHFPQWIETNFLFRKLFLLRKLFLTRNKSSHYGQMGEDIALQQFFPKRYKGFFVDVGCFHPRKYSNTYRFYKKGWRGINIDIDAIKIEGFNLLRSKDTNINCAISNQTGEITYWTNGFYTPTVTLDKSFAESKSGKKYQYRAKTAKADTLSNIIAGTKYENQKIDLLSIDVEGHDFEVIKSLDFEKYAPRIIAVESQHSDFELIQEGELYIYLTKKNYSLVNWVGMTLMFIRKD